MIEKLFTPKKIGNCVIPNRLVVPALATEVCTEEGILTERFIKYHEEKAKGGWGLIITEDYGVTADGRGYGHIPGLWNDEQIIKNKELTSTIHKYESKIFCQIYYAGKQKMVGVPGEVLAPSAVKDPIAMSTPREMTIDEIKQVVNAFGDAARRVKESGFDGLEIHAAHGYLVAQFISGFVNKRTDEYGGCFDNRVRILDEIYASVRENVGKDFPISIRISVNEYVTGGMTEAEAYEFARHLDELGVDAINVSNGVYASDANHHCISSMFAKHAMNMDAAYQIKKLVSCPVLLVNRINDPKMADTLIKMDKTDFVDMGRGSVADPYLPKKTKEGKFKEINYCIGCLQGCENGLFNPGTFTCLVNPRVTREYEEDLSKKEVSKNVMIIGTGPAGMMAARTAATKGHTVTVYDKDTHFGGTFRSAAYPMGKGELTTVISSYREQCINLGVKFNMGVGVTENIIKQEHPDAIIIATGSRPFAPNIPGINNKNVFTAEDVLYGNVNIPAGPVVVCGGGEVGCETAEFISQTNRDVTVIEMKNQILTDMILQNMLALVDRMRSQQIRVLTDSAVQSINDDSVTFKDISGKMNTIPATSIISAFGYKAYNPLEEVAKENCSEVYVVGSAVKAGNALTATSEGYKAALKL